MIAINTVNTCKRKQVSMKINFKLEGCGGCKQIP